MEKKYFKIITTVIVIAIIVLVCNCELSTKEKTTDDAVQSAVVDYYEIQQRGTIIACLSTNSTDYFVYKGKPMGFQLELLNKFAEIHDLKLEIRVENDLINAIDFLQKKDVDIIAQSLTITPERKEKFTFTEAIAQTRQVLVQRKRPLNEKDTAKFISSQLDLAGKTIVIQKGGAAYDRLVNLSNEIAEDIHINENDTLEMEGIIQLVASGEIDYAVCDKNVAVINSVYYTNLDIQTNVSFPQNLAWGVRKESPDLKDSIDSWLIEYKNTAEYKYLYHKYYNSQRAPQTMASEFYSGKDGKISVYDDIIKAAADLIEWDWRLYAALIYQESRFDPSVESWAGAFGIVQLMPSTADFLGVSRESSIAEQIYAGARFIKYLDKLVPESVSNHQDRVKCILAGYNMGFGHVADAIRLAEKYGRNQNVWDDNIEYFLMQKSNPKYFNDEVVKFGYCSGVQPISYVNNIIERYEHYRNVIPLS
jgi:membrane-bound lytic murein transglycosylase F